MKNLFFVFLTVFFIVSCSDGSKNKNDEDIVNDVDQISTTDNELTDTDHPDENSDESEDNVKDGESSDGDQKTQGAEGQECYDDSTCDAPYECREDICINPQGEEGKKCYDDGTCNEGLFCEDDVCISKGGLGQDCYDDDTCEDPFVCESGGCFRTGQFITKWKTDETPYYPGYDSDNPNRIYLPLVENGTYNFTVKWGDGTLKIKLQSGMIL